MKIKHSKYKNTGLIFELLVKQVAADTLAGKDSPALSIIKKFFTKKSTLVTEFKLYQYILKNRPVSQVKAEATLGTISEIANRLDSKSLKNQKYELIAEIKKHYDLDSFFATQVREYKPLAALYCLLEAYSNIPQVTPDAIVSNKVTLLEHLTSSEQDKEQVKDAVMEEYSKLDKDVKLLTFKILLKEFNQNYQDLLPGQKRLLREFITSTDSTPKLRGIVNTELHKIAEQITSFLPKIKDDILKIKIQEVTKNMKPLSNKEKVQDKHLVDLMQYYELLQEIKQV